MLRVVCKDCGSIFDPKEEGDHFYCGLCCDLDDPPEDYYHSDDDLTIDE